MNIHKSIRGIAVCSVFWVAHSVVAQPIIYPSKGQTADQQNKDTAECRQWAQQNTGVDPVAIAQAQTAQAPATGPGGERLRGAARGAAAGAVVGKVASDDAGKGAAVGATAGVMAGGARARRTGRAEEQAVTNEKERASADLARYQNAFAACMEGRGYSVK